MKVVLINTYAFKGGAAVACRRLMQALQKQGVDARMLVCCEPSETADIMSVNGSWFRRQLAFFCFAWERWTIFVANRFSRKNLFAVSVANSGSDITRHPAVQEADVIHLHWINQGFLSLKDLKKLLSTGKPVVWTMHDMWPMTGICHHARDCERFRQRCGACFFLDGKDENDLSARILKRKETLDLSGVRFVGCSRWLADKARQSTLLGGCAITDIPNPIDLSFWYRQECDSSRAAFRLPVGKMLILFAAVKATDRRKGVDYLIESLNLLAVRYPEWHDRLALVVMGRWDNGLNERFPFPVYPVGFLTDEIRIRNLYSAVDLFVTPSLEENLPNTIMEAMACECPVVGFEVGGIPEMIDHEATGYVARYRSSDDFCEGMHLTLSGNRALAGVNARKKADQLYADFRVGDRYRTLYQQVLNPEL